MQSKGGPQGYQSLLGKLREMQGEISRKVSEIRTNVEKNQLTTSNGTKIQITEQEIQQQDEIIKDFDALNLKIQQIEMELNGMKNIFEKIQDGSLMQNLFHH